MTSLRSVVSGDRRRFVQDGYDLDLTYITNNIIAMGLPSAGIVESTYRNHIDDVSRMLKQYHSDHFMVWNTTSERKYDYEKFNNQVLEFGWPDHHTPPLALIFQACQSMYSWLSSDPKNVAVVHCKAGKGRTGTLICCFLLYANIMSTPGLAMKYFARRRGTSGLMRGGVTIPSQKRYIHYFHRVLSGFRPHGRAMRLTRIIVNGTANFDSKGGCKPYCKIFQIQRGEERLLFTGKHGLYYTDGTTSHDITTRGRSATLSTEHTTVIRVGLVVSGDVLIRFKHKGSILNPNMCRCAFNTEFFPETGGTFRFNKADMDDGYKDKRIHSDFSVDLELEPIMDVPVSDPFPWAPMLQQRVRAIPHIKLLPVSVPAKRTRATTADPTSAHHHLTCPPQSVKLAIASHTAPPTSSLFVAIPTTDTRPTSTSTSTPSTSESASTSTTSTTSESTPMSDPASEPAPEPAPAPAPASAAALSQPDTTPDTVTSLVTSLVGATLSDDDEEIDVEEAEECLEDEEEDDDDDEHREEDVKGEERKSGSTKSTPNMSSSPLEPHHIDLNEIDLLNPATRDRLSSTYRPPLPVKRKASARPPSSAESSPHSSSYKTGSSIWGTDPTTRPTSQSVGASPHTPIFSHHSPHSPSLLTGMLTRVTNASFSGERQRSDARTVGGLLLGRHSHDSPRENTTATAMSILAQTARPAPLDTISPTSSPPISTPSSPSKPPLPIRKLKKGIPSMSISPEITPRQHASSNGIHPDVTSPLVTSATSVEPPPATVQATSTPAVDTTNTEPNADPASAVPDDASVVSSPADTTASQ